MSSRIQGVKASQSFSSTNYSVCPPTVASRNTKPKTQLFRTTRGQKLRVRQRVRYWYTADFNVRNRTLKICDFHSYHYFVVCVNSLVVQRVPIIPGAIFQIFEFPRLAQGTNSYKEQGFRTLHITQRIGELLVFNYTCPNSPSWLTRHFFTKVQ